MRSQASSSSAGHGWCVHGLFLLSPFMLLKGEKNTLNFDPHTYLSTLPISSMLFIIHYIYIAYKFLNFVVEVQLIVDHVICLVFAAVGSELSKEEFST